MSLAVAAARQAQALQQASKSDIARGFGGARETYEGASRLQRRMGHTMLRRLRACPQPEAPVRILDLGCGTGWFTRALLGLGWPGTVSGLDLSPGMVGHARVSSPSAIHWLIADAESVPLADGSVDLIFSNLMVQWCADPVPVLRECRRLLRPGGRMLVSTLLDGTLAELKQAWQVADPGHEHVNHFETEAELVAKTRLALPAATIDVHTFQLTYLSPLALAAELKHLGAGFKGGGRRLAATAPGRVRAMCRAYPEAAGGGVTASYQAAWIDWQKPLT